VSRRACVDVACAVGIRVVAVGTSQAEACESVEGEACKAGVDAGQVQIVLIAAAGVVDAGGANQDVSGIALDAS